MPDRWSIRLVVVYLFLVGGVTASVVVPPEAWATWWVWPLVLGVLVPVSGFAVGVWLVVSLLSIWSMWAGVLGAALGRQGTTKSGFTSATAPSPSRSATCSSVRSQ